jgi:uncharacterized spore protein YtfJ
MSIEEILKTAGGDLQKLLSANNILGDPVDVEDKTLVPVIGFGFGYGSGGGGRSTGAELGGTGSGSAGGVVPTAVIIVYKGIKGPDGFQVLSLKEPNPIIEAIGEAIPTIVENIPKTMETMRAKKEKE